MQTGLVLPFLKCIASLNAGKCCDSHAKNQTSISSVVTFIHYLINL